MNLMFGWLSRARAQPFRNADGFEDPNLRQADHDGFKKARS
jgi:hypothetical protein